MIMKKHFSITGTIIFSAIGAYVESFISELISSGVYINDIHNDKNIIYISAKRKDYLRISKIAKKNHIKIRIKERRGLYFKLKNIKKHYGIIFGIITSSILILIMTQFIWKIEIKGVDKLTENLIIDSLNDMGIHLGCISSEIDTEAAELMLKNKLDEIIWIDIRANKSKLDIEIYEKETINKPEIALNSPCNIVAARDGVIVDTEVYSGTLIYPKGSGVAKGNIIVSGIVNDGAENLILTHANAKIIAEFSEIIEFRQNFKTNERIKNNNAETEKELMIFGFIVPISDKIENKEYKECEEKISTCKFMGVELPWKIKTNTYYTYTDLDVTRSAEDAIKLLEQKLNIYCKNFFSEYELININKALSADEDGITLSAEIKLRGNIATKQQIYKKTAPFIS